MRNLLLAWLNSEINCQQFRVSQLNLDPESEITFIVPVYNQNKYIFNHLKSIVHEADLQHDIIIINDSSTDQSHSEIIKFLDTMTRYSEKNFTKTNTIKYFRNIWPWYETRCDDFAIRISETDYVIEIQADIKVREKGFDRKMLKMMESDSNLIAISGRGTHRLGQQQSRQYMHKSTIPLETNLIDDLGNTLKGITNFSKKDQAPNLKTTQEIFQKNSIISASEINEIFPTEEVFYKTGRAGFLAQLIDLIPYEKENPVSKAIRIHSDRIWRGETVMRGPLILSKNLYLKLGGFDTNSFFLGNDDHDLFYRARQVGLLTAYMPVFFSSPLSIGNTRMKKSIMSKFFYAIHKYARLRNLRKTSIYKFIS